MLQNQGAALALYKRSPHVSPPKAWGAKADREQVATMDEQKA
jgi:hypothetical protein